MWTKSLTDINKNQLSSSSSQTTGKIASHDGKRDRNPAFSIPKILLTPPSEDDVGCDNSAPEPDKSLLYPPRRKRGKKRRSRMRIPKVPFPRVNGPSVEEFLLMRAAARQRKDVRSFFG
jgi:hypothetical protein